MSFPAYDEYNQFGLPQHWDAFRLKRDLEFITSGSRGWAGNYSDDGELFIRIGNLTRDRIALDLSDVQRVNVPDGTEGSRTRVEPGDVLFSVTAYLGSVAVVPESIEPAYVSQHVALARLRQERMTPEWVAYASLSAAGKKWFDSKAYGGTKIQLSLDDVRDFPLPIPPLDEQKAISSFLDVETSKIDGLVSEQRRLTRLLKEKRQAVISHAVTKGLNPNAPMKDSGIEWLGEVPEYWEVMPVHRLAQDGHKTFTDGDWIERPYVTDSGVRLLQTGNVGIGHFKEQGFRYIAEKTFDELNCTELKPRDVLVCRLDGPVGRACLAPHLGVRMITSVDNAILKVRDDIHPDYVVDVFTSKQWLSWIEAICRVGGGFRLRISRSMLGNQRFPVPPYEEQVEIAEFIDREQAKTDTLAAEAERAIELLQERRTALISAAVTGKIDVREFASGERQGASRRFFATTDSEYRS